MLESSKDILNLTIAFCVVWFTVFLLWIMYYVVSMLKKANDSMKLINTIINSINSVIDHTKNKIKNSIASFEFFGMLFKKIVETINSKKQKNKKTKS